MTPYEQIRQACIKANPEILELKMGCEVKYNFSYNPEYQGPEFISVVRKYDGRRWIETNLGHNIDEYIILGRPLHLEDILMVLGRDVIIAGNGDLYKNYRDFECGIIGCEYDLSKSVDNQSEETLKFICENLLTNL